MKYNKKICSCERKETNYDGRESRPGERMNALPPKPRW